MFSCFVHAVVTLVCSQHARMNYNQHTAFGYPSALAAHPQTSETTAGPLSCALPRQSLEWKGHEAKQGAWCQNWGDGCQRTLLSDKTMVWSRLKNLETWLLGSASGSSSGMPKALRLPVCSSLASCSSSSSSSIPTIERNVGKHYHLGIHDANFVFLKRWLQHLATEVVRPGSSSSSALSKVRCIPDTPVTSNLARLLISSREDLLRCSQTHVWIHGWRKGWRELKHSYCFMGQVWNCYAWKILWLRFDTDLAIVPHGPLVQIPPGTKHRCNLQNLGDLTACSGLKSFAGWVLQCFLMASMRDLRWGGNKGYQDSSKFESSSGIAIF